MMNNKNSNATLREFSTSDGLLYYFFSYAICVKCAKSISPKELVNLIDFKEIQAFKLASSKKERGLIFSQGEFQLLVLKTTDWLIIADNWFYTLYHESRKHPILKRIYEKFEVFSCTFGDSDLSYDFLYSVKGEVKRKFVVLDPHFRGSELSEDVGVPFTVEKEFDPKRPDFDVIIPIAYQLGIDFSQVDISEIEYYEYVI